MQLTTMLRPARTVPKSFLPPDILLRQVFFPRNACRQFASSFQSSYRMPAESHPHLRTLMAFPDETSYPELMGYIKKGDLDLARQEVAWIANAIAGYEPVWLYTKARNVKLAASMTTDNVTVKQLDIDQLWIRDTGPILVTASDGTLTGVDTNFNYWGDKRPDIPDGADPAVARSILEDRRISRMKAPFVSEGGALEMDGEGTLIATESSLMDPNRNPHSSKADIETSLHDIFGVRKVIWLRGIRSMDMTDLHVDTIARFGPRNTIVLSRPNNSVHQSDIMFAVYEEAKSVLSASTNAVGEPFEIVEIEEAKTVPRCEEDEWDSGKPATSYVNFYLANGVVVVPIFDDRRTDEQALKVIKRLWPARDVVPVRLNWMAWAGGGVHCATQQWPLLTK